MARIGKIEIILKTPESKLNEVELAKLHSNGARGQLYDHVRDYSADDLAWESEQLAKSHGIYLEWNRAKTGSEKDWMYMIRVSVPGGGPLTAKQWQVFDELADEYTINSVGKPSLRVTTRQNIQFHWVKKRHIVDVVRRIAKTGFFTLNGCGDNVRNILACPISNYSTLFNGNAFARTFAEYFRLPAEPHIEIFEIDPGYIRTPDERFQYGDKLLNRKFKIAFSAVHYDESVGQFIPDNCVELRTNDLGIAPIVEDGSVHRFQVYIGGGQGEKNGKATFAALGQPFGIFDEAHLLKAVDAIVQVQQKWGDRKNRHWARLKYIVHTQGIEWYREQVRSLIGDFELPDPDLDYGDRHIHHGWFQQPANGLLSYGAFIENGRIIDGPNGDLKTMVRSLLDTYQIKLMTTPNQGLLFVDIPPDARESFQVDLNRFGYGFRHGNEYSVLRKNSCACVGLDTCRLAYTDSEKFLPSVIDDLEQSEFGSLATSIGVSGCERQCSRPSTRVIAWIGSGKNRYQLRLMGTEDGRNQGIPVTDENGATYLKSVPREEVAAVTKVLLNHYLEHRVQGETVGFFHQRLGLQAIIEYLKEHSQTASLMERVSQEV